MKLEVKCVMRDGATVTKLKCPQCGTWGDIDEDQAAGRVSCVCACGWHETVRVGGYDDRDRPTPVGQMPGGVACVKHDHLGTTCPQCDAENSPIRNRS